MRRGFPVTAMMRAERRKSAEARQALYDALTLQQKLDKVPANGGKKVRAKLERLMQKAAAKPAETVVQADAPSKKAAKTNKS